MILLHSDLRRERNSWIKKELVVETVPALYLFLMFVIQE